MYDISNFKEKVLQDAGTSRVIQNRKKLRLLWKRQRTFWYHKLPRVLWLVIHRALLHGVITSYVFFNALKLFQECRGNGLLIRKLRMNIYRSYSELKYSFRVLGTKYEKWNSELCRLRDSVTKLPFLTDGWLHIVYSRPYDKWKLYVA
jgi:hypothetical protein